MYLFYRYYSGGKWEQSPYFRTLCSFSFLLFLNITTVLIISGKEAILFGNSTNTFLLRFLTLLIVLAFFLWKIADEKSLQMSKYAIDKIKNGNRILTGYILLSVVGMVLSFYLR